MKKLKLEMDDLRVDSFEVREGTEERGTVEGRYVTFTCDASCGGTCDSCMDTCLNTCPDSCWNTCATCNTCEFHCTHITVC